APRRRTVASARTAALPASAGARARGLGRPRFAQRRYWRLPRDAARERARRTDAWCHRLTPATPRVAEGCGSASRSALPAPPIALAVAEPVFVAAAEAGA